MYLQNQIYYLFEKNKKLHNEFKKKLNLFILIEFFFFNSHLQYNARKLDTQQVA